MHYEKKSKLVCKEYETFSEFTYLCKVYLCITVGKNLRNLYVWESISKNLRLTVFGLVNSYKQTFSKNLPIICIRFTKIYVMESICKNLQVYRKQLQNFSNREQYLERKYCFLVDCASYRSAMVAVWYTNADCDVNEV